MAADESFLGGLHELHARYLTGLYDRKDEDGKPIPVTAAELAQVNAFLAKNEITCVRGKSDAVDELEAKMRERAAKRKRPVITHDDGLLAQEAMDYLNSGHLN